MSAGDIACDVAIADIKVTLVQFREWDRAVVFSEEPEFLRKDITIMEGWRSDNSETDVPAPPLALLNDLLAGGGVSAVKVCPSVRAFLDSQGIAYGEAAVAQARAPHSAIEKNGESPGVSAEFMADIAGVSLPALSSDGTDAVVAISRGSDGLGGSRAIVRLMRDAKGDWHQVSGLVIGIS